MEDASRCEILQLYLSIIRRPSVADYNSQKFNPEKSYFGTISFLRDGYFLGGENLYFESQCWDRFTDFGGQELYAIKCAYSGILQTFFNLGNALALPSISITDNIKDWKPLSIAYDEVRIVCYNDVAINVTLKGIKYDLCPDDQSAPPQKPVPPPPPAKFPPRTPIDISPPYQDPNDGGNTVPNPIDKVPPPPPPVPESCDKCRVTVLATRSDGSTQTIIGVQGNPNQLQFAPISNVVVDSTPGNSSVKVVGGYQVGTQPCGGESNIPLLYALSFGATYTAAEIQSIEIIP
jgi:hypothetical protein